MRTQDVIRRPVVTEKGVALKETERTMCFEVAPDANKVQIRAAVERLFKVKVEDVRTVSNTGKLRRRGEEVFRPAPRQLPDIIRCAGRVSRQQFRHPVDGFPR